MSNGNQVSIEALIKLKRELESKRQHEYNKATMDILNVSTAIELLSGKSIKETEEEFTYDDTNPDYIKQSIED